MKHKVIFQGKEARNKLKQGVDLVADIIKTTLGPKGRNIIVKNIGPLPPRSMNDGYYIADHIQHDDAVINAGIDMVKEICKKTNDVAGDGTTTTAVLAQRLIDLGLKEVEKGRNPVDIKKEMEADLANLKENLKEMSQPIATEEDVKNIATISGNNDPEIGEALKEIHAKVGRNSAIMVEKSNESVIRTETIKGIYFDKGFDEAKAFVNNTAKMVAEYKDIKVLCVDEVLEYVDDIAPFFEKLISQYQEQGKGSWDIKLLLIANEIPLRMDAMTVLAENNRAALLRQTDEHKNQAGFYCVAVQAPEFGPIRSEILEDIAIATGGVCISRTNGLKLRDADPKKVLGHADKVIVTTNTTTIIGGKADEKMLEDRINIIKGEIEQLHVNAKVTREKLEKRLQVISAGVGIIFAGGSTEMESKERHLRIEDAVLAVKSAIEEGVSIGGGLTYLKLSRLAKTSILKEACQSVIEQVADNAGQNVTEVIKNLDEEKLTKNIGFNALSGVFEDLEQAGVLDSTKVVRVALENAVSLASLFLTTSAAVIEEIVDEPERRNV